MKQITITTLGILMMSLALAMYGGESISFETNITNPVYTVVGNGSSLEGLNITFENSMVTISPALNYKPDNFTLIFFDNKTMEVEKIVYRGGGGSRTKYVDRNVTVYVPEYITTVIGPEETTEEKVITKIIYDENGFKLWELLVFGAMCLVLGLLFMNNYRKEEIEVEEE